MLHRQQRAAVAVAGQRFDERVGEKARVYLGSLTMSTAGEGGWWRSGMVIHRSSSPRCRPPR